MIRRSLLLFLFSIIINQVLIAQVLPKEGSQLNYRIVGFSFPVAKQTNQYKIEIASGNYYSEDSFKRNIIKTIDCKTGNTIGEVPAFGKQYTWRVNYVSREPQTKNELYHFSTGIIPEADTTNTRLKIINAAKQYNDAYVFVDGGRALYDMKGNPVWYLPYIDGAYTAPRDLKMSLMGTITFLLGAQAYEVNYNGDILWKGPDKGTVSGDTSSEYYHHEFTRLANGHYMVLGDENYSKKLPAAEKDNSQLANDKLTASPRKTFGTIIEYDEKNNVVWSWKCSKYFLNSDIANYKGPESHKGLEVHQNAFFFDENTKMIYIGFKNISRIIKIKYPEGTVVSVFGEIFQPGISEKGNGMFCGQHSCGVTHDGYLYVFNNNDCNWPDYPSIVMMEQPISEQDTPKTIWEYPCNLQGITSGKQQDNAKKEFHRTGGGNVIELPDGSMFASLYAPYSNVFIVNRNKEILWNAIAEKWNGSEWTPNGQYRASIITNPKDLERLIWNQEKSSASGVQ